MRQQRVKDTPGERATPAYWVREMNACIKRNEPEIRRMLMYRRWYRGDMTDLIDPNATPNMLPWQASLDNMHTFVTDAAIAQMFFRNPRFSIRCPSGVSRGVFTPGLARVEAAMLNDTIEQIGYFRRARRRLLDARLGPFGVLKFTYERDVAVDIEKIEEGRLEAQMEHRSFMVDGPKGVRAVESQLHTVHIDEHRKLLADMERGVIPVPKSVVKFWKNHIRVHETMLDTEAPTEFIRHAAVVCRRVDPVNFFYDCTVDDIADARWYGTTYLVRKRDVLADDSFAADARAAANESTDLWVRQGVTMPAGIVSTGTFDNADAMIRVNEIVSLEDGVVREFFEGGQIMAREREFTMRTVQPSGPFSILMFKQDPQEACGLSPPIAWAAEQAAATAMQSAIVAAGIASCNPKGIYNSNLISAEKVEEVRHGGTDEWFAVAMPGSDADIRKAMMPAPEIAISEQSLIVRSDVRGRISQSSGLGAQRSLSGDKGAGGDTATGQAITASAAEAISEDMAAQHDEVCAFDGKMIVRITRAIVPKDVVVATVGPEAEQWYPETGTWAHMDIVNDRNVYVVPGSSRRRSTSVDTKLLGDGLVRVRDTMIAIQSMPPAQQELVLELERRWWDDTGFSGLDWDAVVTEAKMMAMLMQQAAAGVDPNAEGGDEGSGEGAPSKKPKGKPSGGGRARPSENEEPSRAGQAQGVANVGGGRVPTGASRGDNVRLLR